MERNQSLDEVHNQFIKTDAAINGLWTACNRAEGVTQEMADAYATLVERFATALTMLDAAIPGGCPDQ